MELIKAVITFIAIAVFAAVAYFGMQRYDNYLRNTAIHDCAQAYRIEYTENGRKINRPLEQQVRECVWQKGVRNWEGVWTGYPTK